MAHTSYRTESKKDYGTANKPPITIEQLNCGSLMRIADATEKMASNYTQLQNDRDWYKKKYHEQQDEIKHLNNRISSLKGTITKMKKKNNPELLK